MSSPADLRCAYTFPGPRECGRTEAEHQVTKPSGATVIAHAFTPAAFPTPETAYEIWEVRDGKPSGLRASGMPKDVAQRTAREWTVEAEETYAAESRGPVKPTTRRGFVAVQVTSERTTVA